MRDKDGWTAVHFAARFNRVDAVNTLIEHGANPNLQDIDGWTALHNSARNGQIRCVQVGALVPAGAGADVLPSRILSCDSRTIPNQVRAYVHVCIYTCIYTYTYQLYTRTHMHECIYTHHETHPRHTQIRCKPTSQSRMYDNSQGATPRAYDPNTKPRLHACAPARSMTAWLHACRRFWIMEPTRR
jgi:hypothetical protein